MLCHWSYSFIVGPVRLELTTLRLKAGYSYQLSYGSLLPFHQIASVAFEIRTLFHSAAHCQLNESQRIAFRARPEPASSASNAEMLTIAPSNIQRFVREPNHSNRSTICDVNHYTNEPCNLYGSRTCISRMKALRPEPFRRTDHCCIAGRNQPSILYFICTKQKPRSFAATRVPFIMPVQYRLSIVIPRSFEFAILFIACRHNIVVRMHVPIAHR